MDWCPVARDSFARQPFEVVGCDVQPIDGLVTRDEHGFTAYQWYDLRDCPEGTTIRRVSCYGTTHEFTLQNGEWVYSRTEAPAASAPV
jgi:hypothetical protein